MATKKLDKEDIGGLLEHIDGHLRIAREALARSDAMALREQAEEIESWARSIAACAKRAGG